MKDRVFSESYRITSFLVNLRHRAGLYAVLNLVQDVGWQHAVNLGFDLSGQGLLWVFTRQKLVMQRWPSWNEVVELRTWMRPPNDTPFMFRDYEIWLGREKLGECTSSFTLIDEKTRKVGKPDWSSYQGVWCQEGILDLQPGKILPQDSCEDLATFQVRNSDLDLNNHVNNTRYAQWILDAVPLPLLKTAQLHEYEINFLAETKKGDEITLQRGKDAGAWVHFQGLRKADGKAVFTAKLKISEGSNLSPC